MFQFDSKQCTGCGACAVACMDLHNLNLRRQKPLRVIQKTEQMKNSSLKVTYLSTACMHCSNPQCVKSCSMGCLEKDASSGIVRFDPTNCTGCQTCGEKCPFHAITFDLEGHLQKCDGCYHLVSAGANPVCAEVCPMKAISWKF
jgi:anaerobic dimethyl sulfoxide reductase subunit B (iron-sulfur subunit)